MRNYLIIGGILLILAGLLWPWLSKIPLGRLPGDILINRPNFKLYIPLTTMLILSALISVILWLFRR